jgi:hypothetical protein
MKRFMYSLVLAVLLVSSAVPDALACSQGGACQFGGCGSYDYAYNGSFIDANCGWSFYNGALWNTSGNTMCGYIADHYARFTKNGTLTNPLVRQYITIPSTETRTSWAIGYNIEVIDPHSSSTNYLTISVIDTTTSTTYFSETFYGNGVDPNCAQKGGSFSTGSSVAGHTLEIRMQGNVNYTDTDFRVTNVQLPAGR